VNDILHPAVFLGSYLVGSISWSLLIVRLVRGEDLRNFGSGNLGATNAGRLLGKPWAVGIYVLDMAKGLIPVLIAARLSPSDPPPLTVLAGLGAILGHVFPFYLRFRGGKGVATGSGVLLGLHSGTALVAFVVWVLVLLLTRFVSVASVGAAIALPVTYALLEDPAAPGRRWILGFLIAVAILVAALHRSNLRRVAAGTEHKIGGRS
jgi:acyl phosphate:glycerol-3-phosphate acyltransferase